MDVVPGKEKLVWGLKKGLYRLVQVGRTWNVGLDAHMKSILSLLSQLSMVSLLLSHRGMLEILIFFSI